MTAVRIRRSDGDSVTLDGSAIESLKADLRGTLLFPGDVGYDASRTVWNAMIDRRPAVVVYCAGVNDIKRAVDFARTHGLMTSVKGGGHNIAGSAVCEGGLLIDLSGMRSVRVDPEARVAHVEPGATLGDFDAEAQAFGLSTPLGINSTTGVAGLTLGGGFGWFSRKHGMTIDNLLAVDVITAEGRLVRANDRENSDLFWALRGGGGNFGIVTRFEFRLHPLGPGVLSGLVVYPLKEAASALKQYRRFAKEQSDETTVWAVLRKAPPLPFLPPTVHGTGIVAFALFHAGDPEIGRKAIEPVRHFGKALGEHIGVQPYRSWQQAFDPLLTPGARNYWKSHNSRILAMEPSRRPYNTLATSRHHTAKSFSVRSAEPRCGLPQTPRRTPIATRCMCATSTAAGIPRRKTGKGWSGRGGSSATWRRTPRAGCTSISLPRTKRTGSRRPMVRTTGDWRRPRKNTTRRTCSGSTRISVLRDKEVWTQRSFDIPLALNQAALHLGGMPDHLCGGGAYCLVETWCDSNQELRYRKSFLPIVPIFNRQGAPVT
jgi:FAD/FMN-containing dehydrogenase